MVKLCVELQTKAITSCCKCKDSILLNMHIQYFIFILFNVTYALLLKFPYKAPDALALGCTRSIFCIISFLLGSFFFSPPLQFKVLKIDCICLHSPICRKSEILHVLLSFATQPFQCLDERCCHFAVSPNISGVNIKILLIIKVITVYSLQENAVPLYGHMGSC